MSTPPRGRFSAAACTLIHHQGDVLLLRHGTAGTWVMPGGKSEQDESPRQTAGREAQEESGVPVTITRHLGVMYLPGEGTALNPPTDWDQGPFAYPCFFHTFAGTIADEDRDRIHVPEPEITGHAWVPLDRAATELPMADYIALNTELAIAVWRDLRSPYYTEA